MPAIFHKGTNYSAVSTPQMLEDIKKSQLLDFSGIKTTELFEGLNKRFNTLPYSTSYRVLIEYNDEIHLIGGSGTQTKHYSWSYYHDWEEVDTAPSCNNGFAVVYHDKIHLFSGQNHYTYDETDGWLTASDTLPNVNETIGKAVVFNDKIYVFRDMFVFCYDGSTWESSVIPFTVTEYTGVIVYNDQIHIFGCSDNEIGNKHYTYDPKYGLENSFSMPVSTHKGFICPVIVNNELHLLGCGCFPNSNVDAPNNAGSGFEHYKLCKYSWVQLPNLVDNGSSRIHSAVSFNNTIYFIDYTYLNVAYNDILFSVTSYLPKDVKIFTPSDTEVISNLEKQEDGSLKVLENGYIEFKAIKMSESLDYFVTY